ncbi:MAG: hypothetical protein INR71_08225 [Terriglobus roseus]|nr:hypothetical protein [Terriglobus roseus]
MSEGPEHEGSPASAPGPPRSALAKWPFAHTFGLLLAFRVVNALTVRTFFQPDEYFQSLEPAWQLAFGRGSGAWLTWVGVQRALLLSQTARRLPGMEVAKAQAHVFLRARRNGGPSFEARCTRPSSRACTRRPTAWLAPLLSTTTAGQLS